MKRSLGAQTTRPMPTLGELIRMQDLPDDHVIHQMNLRVADPGDAAMALELELAPKVLNGYASLQGGMLATLVDVVGGHAVRSAPFGAHAFVTRDLSIHYLHGLVDGPVRAVATVCQQTKSSVVIRVDVCDRHGSVGAIATVAFAVRPQQPNSNGVSTS